MPIKLKNKVMKYQGQDFTDGKDEHDEDDTDQKSKKKNVSGM